MGKWYNSDALYINSKTVVSAFHKSAKTKEILFIVDVFYEVQLFQYQDSYHILGRWNLTNSW